MPTKHVKKKIIYCICVHNNYSNIKTSRRDAYLYFSERLIISKGKTSKYGYSFSKSS